MVDIQTIAAIIFIALMILFLYWQRKKIYIQRILFPVLYFAMYKTQWGIDLMDKIAKKLPRTVRVFGYTGIIIGFLGMAFISVTLIYNLIQLFFVPTAASGVGLVLPFRVKGSFFVPFFYWIIAIFILAVVHEFSHGVVAKVYGLKIKSSGLAFLGVIVPVLPAAFVEPDEKALRQKSHREQLSVFAAGPLANIIVAFLVVLLFVVAFTPLANAMLAPEGVRITGLIDEQSPAALVGLERDQVITHVNDVRVFELANFSALLNETKPGDTITLKADNTTYRLKLGTNPENENLSYMGVYIRQEMEIKETFSERYGNFTGRFLLWLIGLFYWLYVLNLGIGLFNLLPLGPLDGGRMFLVALTSKFGEARAMSIWKNVSLFFLFIIIVNLLFAFF